MNASPHPTLVAVDIGNQQIKFGLFDRIDGQPVPAPASVERLPTSEFAFGELIHWLPESPVQWLTASVQRAAARQLAGWVGRERPGDSYRRVSWQDVPMEICVPDPQRVGTDRLMAALTVNQLRRENCPAVVVDAGSAITVDLVSADGSFAGGAILPGFQLLAEALAQGTDLLPLVDKPDFREVPVAVGTSTTAAIYSGLFWGRVGAVRELVARIAEQLDQPPELFLGGGDAARLSAYLLPKAQIVPELALTGIALLARHLTLEDRA